MKVRNYGPKADQIKRAYRTMTDKVRYRPAAPSDGAGNITVPDDALDFDDEADRYTNGWLKDEDKMYYYLGCPDFEDREALIYMVEAGRLICGMDRRRAVKLLRLAADDLEKRSDRSTRL